MNWYVVKICFEISSTNAESAAQAEEQLRLILAGNEKEAYEKGCMIASGYESAVINTNGDMKSWKFIGIRFIQPLDELKDSSEIHSEIVEPDDMKRYKHDLYLHNHDLKEGKVLINDRAFVH